MAQCCETTPPIVPATRVPNGPPGFMQFFSTMERDHVRSLKKRERNQLMNRLECGMKRPRWRGTDAPLRIQVLQSNLSEPLQMQLFQELRSPVPDKYMQWVQKTLKLPLGVQIRPNINIADAKGILDRCVAGHQLAKREVLKLVCQANSGGTGVSGYSLGLEGPPGTGKTHFVRTAMAQALKRPFVSIPLGGATDLSYLLGHAYTYEGSKEGRLANALIESQCCNPIVHFDEVDKISPTERGQELSAYLIHLIDPSQNTTLRDRYFHGIDLDFSKCTFVFSYNDPSRVSPILLDRIKRIRVETSTLEERESIVRQHLVPRVQSRLNMSLTLSPVCIRHILDRNRQEGMRGVEKDVDHVLASAQLSLQCDGIFEDNVRALRDGFVTEAFAEACLNPCYDDGAPPPPSSMYT